MVVTRDQIIETFGDEYGPERKFIRAWNCIVELFGDNDIGTYESDQRYTVYVDCMLYGLSHQESLNCAVMINSDKLPKITFRHKDVVTNDKSPNDSRRL